MRHTLFGVVTAVATLIAGTAAAQSSFDGGYAGLKLGYGFGQYDLEYSSPSYSASYEGIGAQGPSIGLLAGYGQTFGPNGSTYLGGELDLTASDISAEFSDTDGYSADLSEQYSGIAALRAGFVPMDNWMIFGRLGLGATQNELEYASPSVSGSEDETQMTYLAGVGLEGFVTDRVSLRLDWSYRIQEDQEATAGNESVTVEPSSGIAEVAISYHF